MQVAVISKAKTMAIVFDESNLPEWTNRMVKIKQGQEVVLLSRLDETDIIQGRVESFSNNTNGAILANVVLPSGKKHSVQLVHRLNQ